MNILVTFHLKNHAICSVSLEQNNQEGCCWQIQSDQRDYPLTSQINEWMEAYTNRQLPPHELPLAWPTLPLFTKKILTTLAKIPFGHSLSYKELSSLAGHPLASRPTGNACGRNPFPLIIPCHRILAAHRRMGGFSQGLEIKRRLLHFEHIQWHSTCLSYK